MPHKTQIIRILKFLAIDLLTDRVNQIQTQSGLNELNLNDLIDQIDVTQRNTSATFQEISEVIRSLQNRSEILEAQISNAKDKKVKIFAFLLVIFVQMPNKF